MGVNRLNSGAESNQFEKKSKVGINEMFSNCFVQYQHSSVQLVLKKWIDIPS